MLSTRSSGRRGPGGFQVALFAREGPWAAIGSDIELTLSGHSTRHRQARAPYFHRYRPNSHPLLQCSCHSKSTTFRKHSTGPEQTELADFGPTPMDCEK